MVAGPRTNVAFLHALAQLPAVRDGNVDTGLIEREGTLLGAGPHPPDLAAAARATEILIAHEQARIEKRARKRSNEKSSPWNVNDAFGLNAPRETTYALDVDGKRMTARVRFDEKGIHATIDGTKATECSVIPADDRAIAWHKGRQTAVSFAGEVAPGDQANADGVILAPMHGKVLAVHVRAGETVKKGQALAVIEAMKMEHALLAPMDGEVAEISVSSGEQVRERAKIAVIREKEKEEEEVKA
jgi:3-methylcrotonyl-CoA carboxylase alpha subunit